MQARCVSRSLDSKTFGRDRCAVPATVSEDGGLSDPARLRGWRTHRSRSGADGASRVGGTSSATGTWRWRGHIARANRKRPLAPARDHRSLRREHVDGEREGAPFTGLQRADADDLATDLLPLVVLDGDHHRILPRLPRIRVANGAIHTKGGEGGLRLGTWHEAQVLAARRTDRRAREDDRPAVRTGSRRTCRGFPNETHDA